MSTYDQIIEKGRQIGLAEVRQEMAIIKQKQFATSLILETDFNDLRIASILDISEELVSNLRLELMK